MLTRVKAITAADELVVEHDAKESSLPDSRAFGAVPRAAVRGIVLCAFAGDTSESAPVPEAARGR
mgnify:CR=1 FL=1